MVKYKLNYEECCSVIQLNAASSDKTYNNVLISCCIHSKLVSAPLFLIVKNPLQQFIWVELGGTLSCLEAKGWQILSKMRFKCWCLAGLLILNFVPSYEGIVLKVIKIKIT